MNIREFGLLMGSINGIIIPISLLVKVARNKEISSLYKQLSYCGAALMFGLGIVSAALLIIMMKPSIIERKSPNEKLLDAAKDGKITKIKSALAKGANINCWDYINHDTVLHIVARKGDLEAIRYLIDEGADINAQNTYGNTPLSYAIENEHVKIIKYLLKKGANVDLMPFHTAREFQRIREMTHLGKIIQEYKKGNLKVILDYTDYNNQHRNNNIKQLVLEFKEIKRRCNSSVELSFIPRYLLIIIEDILRKKSFKIDALGGLISKVSNYNIIVPDNAALALSDQDAMNLSLVCKSINKNANSRIEIQHKNEIITQLEKVIISQDADIEAGGPQIGG